MDADNTCEYCGSEAELVDAEMSNNIYGIKYRCNKCNSYYFVWKSVENLENDVIL
jgi:DNA-directed RNA polymerase subunit RPC12/RpoP